MLLENATAGVAQTVVYRPINTPPVSVVIEKTPDDSRPVRLQVPGGNPGHATDDPVGIMERPTKMPRPFRAGLLIPKKEINPRSVSVPVLRSSVELTNIPKLPETEAPPNVPATVPPI